jgi:acyl-CoA synthetase (AMP-forming)/AMP-acid ligase II
MIDRDYTYGELNSASAAASGYLLEGGGQRGDRVLLLADNSFLWVATYLGTLQAGLVCVPLPPSIAPQDLDYIFQSTEPRFVFAQMKLAQKHKDRFQHVRLVTDAEISSPVGGPSSVSFAAVCTRTAPTNIAECAPDDLAALMFTSGSTGKPRGVMVSHGNIMANTESIVQYLGLSEKDRIMAVLPFHYCFGTSLLHTHLRVGASLVIDSRFMYPDKILDRMQETECTGFAGVPSHFQILVGKTSLAKRRFPHLRYVQQAGGHLAPAFVQKLRQALPLTQIFVMYGQTEATARLAHLPPELLDKKLGSIGKAIPGVRLRVVDQDGNDVKPGETGEIIAEGANIAHGYWLAPEESAKSFRDGRLYTGDLATVDEEGFIYVVDRSKEFLKCGGKRVSCRQLEEKLLECDDLVEAAIIGVADNILGEAVKAFVVPRRSHSRVEEQVRLFCKRHLPLQFAPRDVVVMDSLPKNSAGKVLKQTLKEL